MKHELTAMANESLTIAAPARSTDALTIQLLAWVASRRRTYGETMEAWRTTCPRMPIWENAVSEGLIRLDGRGAMRERIVRLTDRGKSLLITSGQS
jgi:hypothetical protein